MSHDPTKPRNVLCNGTRIHSMLAIQVPTTRARPLPAVIHSLLLIMRNFRVATPRFVQPTGMLLVPPNDLLVHCHNDLHVLGRKSSSYYVSIDHNKTMLTKNIKDVVSLLMVLVTVKIKSYKQHSCSRSTFSLTTTFMQS